MAEGHLHLQGLEFIRHSGLGLLAHLLPSPLLDAVKFLVEIHRCGGSMLMALFWRVRKGIVEDSCSFEWICGVLIVAVGFVHENQATNL